MPASGASSPFSHPSYSFSTSTLVSHPPSWTSTPSRPHGSEAAQLHSPAATTTARAIDIHSGHAGSRPRHNKGHRSSVLLNPPQIGDRASSLYSAHFAASTASLACSPDPPRPAFYSHTNYTAFELSSNRRYSTINSGASYYPGAGSEWCTAQQRVAFAPPPTSSPSSSSSSVSSGQATPGRKSLRSKWDALLRAAHIGGGRKKSASAKGSKPASRNLISKSVYDLPSSTPLELYSNPQPYYIRPSHEAFLSTAYSSGNSSRMSLSVSAASSSRPGQILFESPELPDSPERSMLPPPAIPARSRLRPAAEIVPSLKLSGQDRRLSGAVPATSASELHLPMRALSVDPPLPVPEDTPSLSSDSSSEHDHESEALRSPVLDSIVWGKRKRGYTGMDPLKIKDGVSAKTSSSGVYTRQSLQLHQHHTASASWAHTDAFPANTFPGPQGGQTSPQTGVYTPNTFTLFPVRPEPQPIPGPSRQTSVSSSLSSESSLAPRTPMIPATSRFSTKGAMSGFSSGFKRISSTISSTSTALTPTWRSPPGSARESTFASAAARQHSRTSSGSSLPAIIGGLSSPEQSYTAFMPGSTTPGLGLGVISESQARAGSLPVTPGTPRPRIPSAEEKKVKRKQVPRVSGEADPATPEPEQDNNTPCHAL